MNIFLHELRSYRKSTIIWIASLSLLTIVFLLMYPAFTNDVAASKKILANLPLAVRQGLGISLNNFFTIYGFYAYLYVYVVLAGAIQAMNLGVSVISKEESGKTADFLLTKPVSRAAVITSKLLAVFSLLAITSTVYISISFVAARIISKSALDAKVFLLLSLTLLLVQVAFLALGVLFSVIIPKVKSVITVSMPTVFIFFIIGALGAIIGNQNVRYITPFKFYDSNYIINNGSYEVKYMIIEAVFVAMAIAVSYVIFIKKDIRAAS
jgi:ABC-2 type transport system permease protein